MRLIRWTVLATLALTAAAPASPHAFAQSFARPPYDPDALAAVGHAAAAAADSGLVPIVILDVDDTLIDTRDRTARILAEFAQKEPGLDDQARAILMSVPLESVAYEVTDTLKALGIDDRPTLADADAFWKARFFTSDYAREDVPVRAAPEYVRWLTSQGAHPVYLTGRPAETMRDGTIESFARNGFPSESDGALLLMKPHATDDDLAFKTAAFARIAAMGEVVGVFENEPRNINAMHAAFPRAVAIFVDTIHSGRPDVPADGVAWVRDLSLELENFAHDRLAL